MIHDIKKNIELIQLNASMAKPMEHEISDK